MKEPLNEQFRRMQKIAGVINESITDEQLNRIQEMLKFYLEDSKEMLNKEDKDYIIMYLQNTLRSVIDIIEDYKKVK
jgi:hypothetical protein